MAELEETLDEDSPFHPNNAAGLSLITLMRLYDVSVAILAKLDPETKDLIVDAHSRGEILGSLPAMDMEIDDEVE